MSGPYARWWSLALLFAPLVLSLSAAQDKQAPARWEKAIAAFEKQDRESPPPKGAVLFVGSSSIRLWDLKKSFPDLPTINRGFGGSQIADSTHFAARLVNKHAPQVVVFYAGDNDIATKKTPERLLEDFRAFVKAVHAALPGTKILFIAVKPSPRRWEMFAQQQKANALIEAYCRRDERLHYLDVVTPMLGKDGMPRGELFAKDRLHLSAEGYQLWNGLLAPQLKKLYRPGSTKGTAPVLPRIVGHRGLIRHAPENTLAAFTACLELRIGFELDVRRTRDGHLVCLHDDGVKRTTDGKGKVAELTLAEVRRLDAGRWFGAAFAGQRVPTLDEVFDLLRQRGFDDLLVALDIKAEGIEEDVIRLAARHGVLNRVVCIGLAISDPAVRRRLRAADPKAPVAILAQTAADLSAALADRDADWAYVRFVPTAAQVAEAHRAGKRVFLAGPTVAGCEPANWGLAHAAGVDALLTDYPLDCRQRWRDSSTP